MIFIGPHFSSTGIMTLLVFARGRDGFVIASDRKETVGAGPGNEVRKYRLYPDRDFVLALAGDGHFNKALFGRLPGRPKGGVLDVLKDARRDYFDEYQKLSLEPNSGIGESGGFLVIKEGNRFVPYTIRFTRDECIPRCLDKPLSTVGDIDAMLVTRHVLRNVNVTQLPCETVARRLVAAIGDAAQAAFSVGGTDYGFDIVAFMDDGRVLCRDRYADGRTRVRISFEPGPGAILAECKAGGV